MLRVALTGGIATGKSYCLGRFAALGVPTIDADQLAREVVIPGSAGLRAIVERFGDAVLQPGGTLDRAALGRIVFADRVARADLESIVHPEVYRRIREWYVALPPGPRLRSRISPCCSRRGTSTISTAWSSVPAVPRSSSAGS
jgi:dephospho-CoA kinase